MTSPTDRHVGRELSRYLEGELTRTEGERVESHLARCDQCRRELGLLEDAARFLSEPVEASSEREFLRRLDERIDRPTPADGAPVCLTGSARRLAGRSQGPIAAAAKWATRRPGHVVIGAVAAAAVALAVLLRPDRGVDESEWQPAPIEERAVAPASAGPGEPPAGSAPDVPAGEPLARDGVAPVAGGAPRQLEAPVKVAVPSTRWRVETSDPAEVRGRLLAFARNHPDARLLDPDQRSVTLSLPVAELSIVYDQIVGVGESRVARESAAPHDTGRILLSVSIDPPYQASSPPMEPIRP